MDVLLVLTMVQILLGFPAQVGMKVLFPASVAPMTAM
jgi:hypothetical protein